MNIGYTVYIFTSNNNKLCLFWELKYGPTVHSTIIIYDINAANKYYKSLNTIVTVLVLCGHTQYDYRP